MPLSEYWQQFKRVYPAHFAPELEAALSALPEEAQISITYAVDDRGRLRDVGWIKDGQFYRRADEASQVACDLLAEHLATELEMAAKAAKLYASYGGRP